MQQTKSVVRIERSKDVERHPNDGYVLANKRKGDKRNKTKRGGGYKGNFLNSTSHNYDVNLMC